MDTTGGGLAALLGVRRRTADSPYYVGFEAAGQHIGLVPGGGPQGMTTPVTLLGGSGHRGQAGRLGWLGPPQACW